MNLPVEVKNLVEQIASSYSLSSLKISASKLSKRYLQESLNGSFALNTMEDVVAYSLIRMPATFASISSALQYGLEFVEDDISSILDVGSGTGSMVLAANVILPKANITCIERDKNMISFSKEIIQNPNFINIDITKETIEHKYDLVSACYFCNELDEKEMPSVLDKIWNASNKYILIVEPGTVKSYARMMRIREFFINKGGNILAPCPHNCSCPLKDDWCHFVTRVSRSKLQKLLKDGDAPYEDEKFTYLFISKNKIKTEYARVLRHPTSNPGFIEVKLCNSDCSLCDVKITKSNPDYKRAKKLNSGDRY